VHSTALPPLRGCGLRAQATGKPDSGPEQDIQFASMARNPALRRTPAMDFWAGLLASAGTTHSVPAAPAGMPVRDMPASPVHQIAGLLRIAFNPRAPIYFLALFTVAICGATAAEHSPPPWWRPVCACWQLRAIERYCTVGCQWTNGLTTLSCVSRPQTRATNGTQTTCKSSRAVIL